MGAGCRQCGHSARTNRCEIVATVAEASRKGSAPISMSRLKTPEAEFAWMVVRMRWPLRPAWMAVRAVSGSRISPTMMTLGS
jgi:hypothetical protein